MHDPVLSLDEAKKVVHETAHAPRVTEEEIKAKVKSVAYARPFEDNPNLTVCAITMNNGFTVVGISAPASPENFNAEVGERYAYDNAFKQLWPLMGFALCDRLWRIERDRQASLDFDEAQLAAEPDPREPGMFPEDEGALR